MPSPLTAGWVDTGISASVTGSLTVAWDVLAVNEVLVGNLLIDPDGAGGWKVVFPDASNFPIPGTPGSGFTAALSFARALGPYRLGATLTTHPTTGDPMLRYAWWADENTVSTESFAGISGSVASYSGPTLIGDVGTILFGYHAPASSGSAVVLRGRSLVVCGAAVDTTGLAGPIFTASGADGIDAVGRTDPSFGVPWTVTFGLPVRYLLDVDVLGAAGSSLGAQITSRLGSPTPSTVSCPYRQVVTSAAHSWDANAGWDEIVSADLAAAWMVAQDPQVPSSEQHVWFRGSHAMKPALTPYFWQPGTVTLAQRANVLLSTNAWIATGAATVSGAGGATWTVTGAGASVARTLKEKWRNWTTLADPLFRIDGFKITKHDYDAAATGQDVWGWGSYAYLELVIAAPASGNLTLTVAGVLAAFNYLTGAKTGETTYSAVYTVPVVAGSNTATVDLLFPDSWSVADGIPSSGAGGPWYHERVDSLTVSGLAVGAYTLSAAALVARGDGYLKLDFSSNLAGLVAAVDGSFVTGLWAQNPQDPPITGSFLKNEEAWIDASGAASQARGGAIPWKELVAAGNIQPRTVAAVLEDLNRIEGFTVAQDLAASDVVLKDGYGNSLTGLHADSLSPLMPHARLVPGAATGLQASIFCRYVQLVGVPPTASSADPLFRVWARPIVGGVLEGIAVDGSGKRLAGGRVSLVRTDTSAIVGTSFADGQGFVTVATGCDGVRGYRLNGA